MMAEGDYKNLFTNFALKVLNDNNNNNNNDNNNDNIDQMSLSISITIQNNNDFTLHNPIFYYGSGKDLDLNDKIKSYIDEEQNFTQTVNICKYLLVFINDP